MAYRLIQDYARTLAGDSVFTVRGPLSPLFMAIPWRRLDDHPLPLLCINKGRESLMALNEREYFAIATDRFALYLKGKVSLKELHEEYDSLARRIATLYDETMGTELGRLSEPELGSHLKKVADIFDELAEKTLYIETIDQERMLSVMGHDKKDLLDSIWETATHPTFVSFEGRRQKYVLDTIAKHSDGAHAGQAVKKVRFIYTDYVWTKDDAEIEAVLGELRERFSEKLEECERLEKEAAKSRTAFEKWKKSVPKEAQGIADYMQLVMLFRDIRKDAIGHILAILAQMSGEFLRRAGIDAKHGPHVLLCEYLQGAAHLKKMKADIEKRAAGFISVLNTDGSCEIELCDFGKAIDEFHERIFKHDVDVKTFKGHIANKGKAVGIARIIIDPHHDKGFRQGDVLVASMTRPEFIHLMKKASAVVTNEGGITCHAAIVSRELKIPCIIGTKIATRVLKDGDKVEVDADKGIVNIIS